MNKTSYTKIGQTGSVKIDMTGLKNLLAGIEEKYVVRVGLLGSKATETHQSKSEKPAKNAPTNAEIGLAHEKGVKSRNLPRRSWLEVPLQDHIGEYFAKLGPKVIAKIVTEQSISAYQDLSIVCEQIIQKGFETGGYGKWKPLKPATIAAKGSEQILIDTGQLRRAVTSQVVKK